MTISTDSFLLGLTVGVCLFIVGITYFGCAPRKSKPRYRVVKDPVRDKWYVQKRTIFGFFRQVDWWHSFSTAKSDVLTRMNGPEVVEEFY